MTPLTRREADLLAALATPYSLQQLARRRGVADKTIRNMASRIYGKMGACNRTHAVALAIRRGWLLLADGYADEE